MEFGKGKCELVQSDTCKIGKTMSSFNATLWPEFSTHPNGHQLVLQIPVDRMKVIDDSSAEARCNFIEKLVASKENPSTVLVPSFSVANQPPAHFPKEYIFETINTFVELAYRL